VSNRFVVKRFFREIQAMSRLSHPNVVWSFDASQTGQVHYLAMQYIPGTTLATSFARRDRSKCGGRASTFARLPWACSTLPRTG